MNFHLRKAWAGAIGLALAGATVTGIAVAAEDPATWYDGDNASVADPDREGGLLFYNGAGTAITSGSTTTKPFAAYVASDTALPSTSHATLYGYTADLELAAGAFSGAQISKTSPIVPNAPGTIDDSKPVYAGAATDFSLAELATAYPNDGGVFQIRLRGSSAAGGVGASYAATYVQITGTTWTVIDDPAKSPSTTTATIPATATAGTGFTVPVTVNASPATAKGTVELREGATVVATGQLGNNGQGDIAVPANALAAGTHTLKAVYLGSSWVTGSESNAANITVTSGAQPPKVAVASTTTAKLVKAVVKFPKKGKLKVTVAAAGVVPTGTVVVTEGKKTLATVTLTAANNGVVKVKLPKLAKGKHKLVASYGGSTDVLASKSTNAKLKVV